MVDRIAPECGCSTGGKIVRGMCATHYDRWVHKTPKSERPPAPRFTREFNDFVRPVASGCWEWSGSRDAKGYGRWSEPGWKGLAHRYSLARETPEPNPGMMACHRCDNPPCVNPKHLYWGTVIDNTRDMVERIGVHNKGVYKTHCSKGHPLEGENLRVVGKDQRRMCRICDNERSRLRMAAKRKAAS